MNLFKNKEDAKIEKKYNIEKEILEKLDIYKKNSPDVLYRTLMKYTNNNYYAGYTFISSINIPGICHNGDILIHSTKSVLNYGDILHFCEYGSDGISQYYLKFKSFIMGVNILVQVQDQNGKDYAISNHKVLGVLIKTIPFNVNDETWEKSFIDFGGNYEWLLNSMKNSLEFWKKVSDFDETIKNKTIQELENRLKVLETKIGEKK